MSPLSWWRDLPILMLSSMPPEEATVKSLNLGATDYIAKPFRVRELLARINARLKESEELRRVRDEARSRGEMVDILHEVTDSLKPDEIYHILTRRVARALRLSKCSMVSAQPGSDTGVVVAAAENPMLRNLEITLSKYPELVEALEGQRMVLIEDVHTDPLYEEVRKTWERDGLRVPTRSSIVLPFSLRGEAAGVFFLRTTIDDAPLKAARHFHSSAQRPTRSRWLCPVRLSCGAWSCWVRARRPASSRATHSRLCLHHPATQRTLQWMNAGSAYS